MMQMFSATHTRVSVSDLGININAEIEKGREKQRKEWIEIRKDNGSG